RLRLLYADGVVVEGDVEVDVLGAVDQTIVGDHRNPLVRGVGELGGEGGAVDGGHDEDVGTVGDHLVELLLLTRNVVIRVLQIDLVTGLLQLRLHGVAVGDPPLRGLRGHRNADGDVLGRGISARSVSGAAPA